MPATRYKVWDFGEPVGRGATGSCYVGVTGIAKAASPAHPYVVSNELLSAHLGRAIGLPIPPGFLVEKDGAPYYVSLNFNLSGENLPPADIAALVCDQPSLAVGILLFDIWIVNGDRHANNLAYDKNTGKVQLFDHSHAFFRQSGRSHLQENRDGWGIANHCLVPQLAKLEGIPEWYERISTVPTTWIKEGVEAASEVGLPQDDVGYCVDYLLDRRQRLVDLLRENKDRLPMVELDLFGGI